jgi:hypothetical protein
MCSHWIPPSGADEDGDGIGDHNPWINELHLDRNGGISVEGSGAVFPPNKAPNYFA